MITTINTGGGKSKQRLLFDKVRSNEPSFWETLEEAPVSFGNNATMAVYDGLIYIVYGGYNCKIYNINTGEWSNGPNISTSISYISSGIVLDGLIYIIGGFVTGYGFSGNVCLDPVTKTWTSKQRKNGQAYSATAVALNGLIYSFGGNDTNISECYDPVTNTWSTKANMPTNKVFASSASVNGLIYVIGGSGGNSNENYCYDPKTNTWTTKAVLPTKGNGMTAAAVNGKIYVLGGYTSTRYTKNECYDPVLNTWSTEEDIPFSNRGPVTCSASENVIYFGGGTGKNLGAYYAIPLEMKSFFTLRNSELLFDKAIKFNDREISANESYITQTEGYLHFIETEVSGYIDKIIEEPILIEL